MKMREVILRAIAKKITWGQAADVLGISYSAMERLRRLYKRRGYDGHWVRASRKTASPQVPLATVELVLMLYQEKYSRLDARAFHEKLRMRHRISLNYSWLEQALREAGLLAQTPGHRDASEAIQTPAKKLRVS
jgi:transposase